MTFRGRGTASKFGNTKTVVDGITFHSRREASRYCFLKQELSAGRIADLELQPSYRIDIKGKWICNVKLDFRYRCVATGDCIVEDSKSEYMRKNDHMSSLKRRLVKAVHDIDVMIV